MYKMGCSVYLSFSSSITEKLIDRLEIKVTGTLLAVQDIMLFSFDIPNTFKVAAVKITSLHV